VLHDEVYNIYSNNLAEWAFDMEEEGRKPKVLHKEAKKRVPILKKRKPREVDDATSQAGDNAAKCQEKRALSCGFGFPYRLLVLV
jgi:hypothetical protein